MLTCQIDKRLGTFRLRVRFAAGDRVTAIFGPSGSGKSLTLQCIAGLIRPDAGRIAIGQQVLFDSARHVDLPPQQRHVGYVFQNYALFPHLSVAANIAYGLNRVARTERAERVEEVLRAVRLQGLEDRRPGQLSGGQQQRVAVARALVTRPTLLLLDEPFSALDMIARSELHMELLSLLQEMPVPTLLVTHHLDEAYALSQDIAVYDAGQVLQFGPRDDVYYRPGSTAVARFVGVRNFLSGRVDGAGADYTRVRTRGMDLWGPPGDFAPGQAVECCIRPEHVMLVRKDSNKEDPAPGEAWLHGTIVGEVPYGGHMALLFRPQPPAGGSVTPDLHIRLPTYVYNRLAVRPGEPWTVALKAEHTLILPADG